MITLTQRAHQQLLVLNALERAELTVAEAATLLGRSTRHVRRLRAAYRARGPAALAHGNRGRRSPHRLDEALRDRVVTLAKTTYAGANHLHLQQLLAEREGLHISYTSLRRLLHDAGLRSPRRRRIRRHRRRRERMPREGMLLQVDGSLHDWLEGRGPWLTLLLAVDDATGSVVAGEFRETEDAHGYLRLFNDVARTQGIPLAAYSDRHGIFHRDKRTPLTLAEQLAGGPRPTQVGRALHELGIRWIPASSPQAKGRIENRFGTFQDRLVTEFRLAGISDREGANALLPSFLTRYTPASRGRRRCQIQPTGPGRPGWIPMRSFASSTSDASPTITPSRWALDVSKFCRVLAAAVMRNCWSKSTSGSMVPSPSGITGSDSRLDSSPHRSRDAFSRATTSASGPTPRELCRCHRAGVSSYRPGLTKRVLGLLSRRNGPPEE